jgi:hypothetical protein
MLSDGRHSFEVRAIDSAGNVGQANATWIRIDRVAPSIQLEQADAQRTPLSVLVVNLTIDDGPGSGPSAVEWSTDNQSWSDFPDDGILLWADWTVLDLHVLVTDGAGNTVHEHLAITAPQTAEGTDGTITEGDLQSKGSGGISTIMAVIVILAIITLSIIIVLVSRRARSVSDSEDDEEESDCRDVDEGVEETASTTVEAAMHVADYTHLPGGGTYDKSTGQTAYVDPEGRWWWQQPDDSFFHDPGINAIDAKPDDLP